MKVTWDDASCSILCSFYNWNPYRTGIFRQNSWNSRRYYLHCCKSVTALSYFKTFGPVLRLFLKICWM